LRLALSLGGGYAVMAFTFSGITFPVMAMYGVAQLLSKAFPLTYFSDVFISQAVVGAPQFYDIIDLGVILLFMLPLMIVWRRFGRVVREDQYWGME
jgi:ABC-2 type transport system permease protein